MTQTFESLVVDIKESIEQCSSPSALTSKLMYALKKAEEFEEEWINELYESDCFDAYIY
jgi:hypothetical protein